MIAKLLLQRLSCYISNYIFSILVVLLHLHKPNIIYIYTNVWIIYTISAKYILSILVDHRLIKNITIVNVYLYASKDYALLILKQCSLSVESSLSIQQLETNISGIIAVYKIIV